MSVTMVFMALYERRYPLWRQWSRWQWLVKSWPLCIGLVAWMYSGWLVVAFLVLRFHRLGLP